ncbi:hypothetical protein KBZ21_41080, partial [Streptomyces sp. A73]|nr:hypothetical protein [Streptomyces sp. A73]
AVQRLKDQTTETKRLKTETAAANKIGVSGSDTVRSAQQRLAAVVTWWWQNIVKRYFALVRTAFRLVATVARWLWHNVLGPV